MINIEPYPKKIPIAGPSITQTEIELVTKAISDGWYENANHYIKLFEKKFSEYIGKKYALALPSCTSAIHLALSSLGIKEGDEVIVPDITWVGSSAPISYVNATPVFADIDKDTWCISPESIEKNITSKTKAIITVDLYGGMPDMDKIEEIAKEHNLFIIEDAAEAIGSEYKKRKAGTFGDCSVFSFHGSKTLTTGEGGILLTDNKSIYERVKVLMDHGRALDAEKMFWVSEVAYKYKMTNMQAALGLAQLERVDELINKKREIFSWYKEEFNNFENIVLNYENENIKNSYWMTTLVWSSSFAITKEELISKLSKYNIDSRPFFYPLSSIPAYKNEKDYQVINPISYEISPYSINLPSALSLTREEVKYVSEVVRSILKNE